MLAAFRGDRWELFRAGLLIAALFFMEYVPEYLATDVFDLKQKPVWFGALRIGCVIVLFAIVVCADLILRTRAMTAIQRNSELKCFEGVWAQNVTFPDRPYSIGLIEFSASQGRWCYCGVGFDKAFRPAADWHTYSLAFESPDVDREWFFAGTAHMRTYDDALGRSERHGGTGNVMPKLSLPRKALDIIEGKVADIEVNGTKDIFGVTLRRVKGSRAKALSSLDTILGLPCDEVRAILADSGVLKGA